MEYFFTADLYFLSPDSTSPNDDNYDEDEPESLNHLSGRQLAAQPKLSCIRSVSAPISLVENEKCSGKSTLTTPKKVNKKKEKMKAEDIVSKPHDDPKLKVSNKDWTPNIIVFVLLTIW